MRRSLRLRQSIVALAALAAAYASAQAYPTRPIRLIVPFPDGGSNDIVGRIVAHSLTQRLGGAVVVENRAGRNAIIGTEIAATSPPDGYTLLVISNSFATNPVIHTLPYNPLKAFAWVALLGIGPNALTVPNHLHAKTVKELIAIAKAKPLQLVYASSGVGGNAHFASELFKHVTGTDLLHVPYKGAGPALIATAGGQAHMCLTSLIHALPLIRASKLRVLATGGEKRSALLPEVPTLIDAGVPGYTSANWWGIVAPKGTAPAIIERLNTAINAALVHPDTDKRLLGEGVEPAPRKPAQLGHHVATEMAKWVEIAKIARIKGE